MLLGKDLWYRSDFLCKKNETPSKGCFYRGSALIIVTTALKYTLITLTLKEKYTLNQIGKFLNISESAVCNFLSRYNQKNH